VKVKVEKLLMGLGVLLIGTLSVDAQEQGMSSLGTMDLTLDKAIDIALAENPTIRVADKDVELKKVADTGAWQSLLPTLDATLSFSHSIKVAEMKIGGNKIKFGQDGSSTATGALTMNLPVFAPAVYQNMKLTKEDILLAQEKARSSRLDLVNQVTKAYYSALLAQDSYGVMKKAYNTSKENFDVVNNKFKVGRVSEYDKISAEVQMRSMNSSLVSAQTGLNLAMLQLKVLMGITANVDIAIDDSLNRYESTLVLPQANDGTLSLGNNSTLLQMDYNMQLLERTRKLLKTNFMPTVAIQLSGQYQSVSNPDWNVFGYSYSPSASVALAVNIPIFHADNWTKLKSNRLQSSQL
jgi:outer membrane protein TolC